MVTAPIWKDTYYTTSAASLTYTIRYAGDIIFTGKAVKFPGAQNLEVNISQICRNFMNNDLPDLRNISSYTAVTNTRAMMMFDLYQGSVRLEQYVFLWDWSYRNWNGASKSMSNPINGHYGSNMFILNTVANTTTVTNQITPGASGSYCGKMALYYQGAEGGWNSFLIEGAVKRTDKLTNHSVSRRVKNTSIDFENKIYSMDVEPSYELSTCWLTDSQAANLAENLLQSPSIYAHDLITGDIFPVVITDTNVQYKTYRTNGRKRVNYVIKVKASQSKTRR